MAAVTSLFFPNHPKISRRRKRRNKRARMRTCHRSSERKFTLCCYFLIFDRDLRGEFGNDFISLCAPIYAREWRIRFIKNAHNSGKPSSSSLFSILSKKTKTTREKTKKKTKERKKWRSTRRRGERVTSSSRPLCSVSAEACITTRWRKGGKN